MNSIQPGVWRVHTVEVNSKPAGDTQQFAQLISTPKLLRLEPAGITFKFQQARERSAVLESRSQIFFADFSTRGERLTINLSRPEFSEKITLVAVYESGVVEQAMARLA